MIYIKAYSDLSKYLNTDKIGEIINYDNKGKKIIISDLINEFNIPKDEVSIILKNGNHSSPGEFAGDGDTIVFFSPVDGG